MDIENISANSELIDDEMKQQLMGIFSKLERKIILYAVLDESKKCQEMASFLKVIETLSDKIEIELHGTNGNIREEALDKIAHLPLTMIYHNDQEYSGIAFHGVPGGKEINSFIMAIYNTAGPGKELTKSQMKKIDKLNKKLNISIYVSLACHYCPEVVAAAQRIASVNKNVEAQMFDAALYDDLVEKYTIERVPMMMINNDKKIMGNQSLDSMIQILNTIS